MSEQEAGPELDSAVAEALGYAVWEGGPTPPYPYLEWRRWSPFLRSYWCLCKDADSDPQHWSPSTDWGDAMHAAEACGLFKRRYLYQDQDGWAIGRYSYRDEDIHTDYTAATGPLCICQAILGERPGA